jgi:hypothetical protein
MVKIAVELKKKARSVNLAAYLVQRGEPLKKSGTRYKHANHDSLVFTNNMFYWNSRKETGNAVDFLMLYYGYSFVDAISELTNTTFNEQNDFDFMPVHDHLKIDDIEISNNMRRAIAYLTQTRSLSMSVLQPIIDSKLLVQEAKTNNALFLIPDENGVIVGAEVVGTLDKVRFKGVKSHSLYGHGFNIRFGSCVNHILLFESAVDLLSFICLRKNDKKDFSSCLLVSLAGLKDNVVKHYSQLYPDAKLFICTDNDEASFNFIDLIKKDYSSIKILLPDQNYKDWNDQLKGFNMKPL